MSLDLSQLNSAQKEAVTHGNGPLLIVAGAGTGKTSVITKRLAYLIDSGLAKTDEILALTFTDKAAGELEERIDSLLPYGYLDLWVHTFHSFAERILKQHGLDIGLPGDFKLLTQTEVWLLVRENLSKFDLDYYRPLGNPSKFIHALLKHFSRCKDEMISPTDYLDYADNLILDSDVVLSGKDSAAGSEKKRLQEIAGAYHTYNQLLLDNNSLDFGDLIFYTLQLFKKRPQLLDAYRKKFKYILVDEFQDTNLAQYELIKLLAEPANNLTVVGDDDQSIYKFRGASISNILHFKKDFPQADLITLVNNYRSAQKILDYAYNLIVKNNPDRLEEKLKINKKLVAQKDEVGIVEIISTKTGESEAKKVAEKILKIKLEAEEKGENVSWNDFAILARSNSAADLFLVALDRCGIPFQFLASSGLFRQDLVLDIVAYLKLLDNYHENPAVFRILNSSFLNIEAKDIIKINHQAKKKTWSIFETLKNARSLGVAEEGIKKIDSFLSLVEKHTQFAKTANVTMVIYAFLNESGYLKNLVAQSSAGDLTAAKQIIYLKQFYNLVESFEGGHAEKLVKHFLDYFNYVMESGDEGALSQELMAGPEAVKIMTAHSAKGLEFKYVFLVNLVEMRFPSVNRADPIELPEKLVKEILPEGDSHLQEERRLFYVGLTRAKKGLFLTWAENYGLSGRERKPSRFLQELGVIEIRKEKEAEIIPDTEKKSAYSSSLKEYAPTHFSFTQLKTFSTCPFQYRFAHILQIPVKGNASFSFGKTMHLTLQKFYNAMIERNSVSQGNLFETPAPKNKGSLKIPGEQELLDWYEKAWIDDWYLDKHQKEEYFAKGKNILRKFYETTEWKVPKLLEVGFHIKFGEYKLRGQIDRIDPLPDGTVEIIDYKTGEPPKNEQLDLEAKEQLLIYQIATAQFLREKPSILSFYYLNNNSKISFIGKGDDLVKIESKIVKEIEEIKNSQFSAKPSPFNCAHCDYKSICQHADLRA
ncbi:MAG: hypothetical protein UT86_C0001G0157 [Candidatus Magasanikbacteria bacterium GW2011_GWC2_40_17]|uniref:DNA 3'-5' helicase n=1 Tax=Candidatus Magasanikbacteria bacterium GW2011_GWA2_42_32 TaxID=1619039 RepID=A0A0G1A8Z1_9BACT|nr:MAG: hypothetical protein UT86_C0001G0157 [Candidatus Magasanikbacteria bacterium GW2011_GWC2_40_17]KKS57517.1 MAG: hypothetical protein UV20_C0001G0157 [Candidatus Magasanikbacteria bacterium GW2011_GWA2_42_32]OGH85232.1 MAG: hypothetical protein A2294_00610 [Candidatus Magasanikbacteria bacterium RIFOXYB2_FULL_38_10]